MLSTSARLLRLLARLQIPGAHAGPDLAAELGVSVRTLRNDVATLRELGYPVEATPGVAGGYRLGRGSRLPPLLLDDEEAMAVTLGLVLAASHGVSDTAAASMRAFSKLVALLPSRLRPRLESLAGVTVNAPLGGPTVSTDALPPIAAANGSGSATATPRARRRTERSSPTDSSTVVAAGTCCPLTSSETTGERSGSTGCG